MFETGQRVGLAVSGGADSVFLLHALRELVLQRTQQQKTPSLRVVPDSTASSRFQSLERETPKPKR